MPPILLNDCVLRSRPFCCSFYYFLDPLSPFVVDAINCKVAVLFPDVLQLHRWIIWAFCTSTWVCSHKPFLSTSIVLIFLLYDHIDLYIQLSRCSSLPSVDIVWKFGSQFFLFHYFQSRVCLTLNPPPNPPSTSGPKDSHTHHHVLMM